MRVASGRQAGMQASERGIEELELEHKLYSLQDAAARSLSLSLAAHFFRLFLHLANRRLRRKTPFDSTFPLSRRPMEGARGAVTERERERERAVRDTLEMESAWRSPAPPWARGREREGRAARGVPRRTRSVCVAGWLWGRERADRQSGRRASRVGMGTVSLSRFQMQMWRGREREGGRAFGR